MTAAIQRLAAECASLLPPVKRDRPQPLKYGMRSGTLAYHKLANAAQRKRFAAQGKTTHGTERKAVPQRRASKYGLDRKAIGHAAYMKQWRRLTGKNRGIRRNGVKDWK